MTDIENEKDFKMSVVPREKNIIKELKGLDFLTTDVIANANIVYQTVKNNSRKGKRRKHLIFYCVWSAYNNLGIAIDPVTLGRKMGLTKSGVTQACSFYGDNSKEIEINDIQTPTMIIDLFCKDNPDIISSDTHQDLVKECDAFIEKNEQFMEDLPRSVAGGYLYYYFFIRGNKDIADQISKRMGITFTTLNKQYQKIMELD